MKVDDVEAEIDDSDDQWTDEEFFMKDVGLALPALRITRERVSFRSVVTEEEEEVRINEQAVVAAQLVMAAAEEAVMKEKSDGKKKKTPKKMKKLQDIPDGSGSSGGSGGSGKGLEESKNPKKKRGSELTNPPEGPPVCKICGKGFKSWKAVFGHMRCHKDRNYQGFLPPPTFSAVAERLSIPGPNSAFVFVTAGGGSSGGFVTTGGGTSGGKGGRDLGFDLNVELVEEDDKSPPRDEEEEEKAK